MQTVEAIPYSQSSIQRKSPRLSSRSLTAMLALMCATPVVTIAVLWNFLPQVYENQLEASVYTEGLPSDEFYEVRFDQRPEFPGGFLIVQNNSDDDWTNVNIQINKNYQIYDIEPIPAKEEKRYELSKFITRSGDRFQLRYNRLKSVRVYARRPSRDRATFNYEFPKSDD